MKLHQVIAELEPTIGQNLSISRLQGAQTNASYKITTASKNFALRLNNPNSSTLGIDRDRELKILSLIGQESWSPEIIQSSPLWMLTLWKNSHRFRIKEQTDILQLLKLLKNIHNINTQPLVNSKPIIVVEQINHLKQFAKNLDSRFSQTLIEVCELYEFPSRLTLCYHDWHDGNIFISANQLMIIDWEYAALGDPLIDLACLISGFKLNQKQIEFIANTLEIKNSRLKTALCLTELMSILWYFVRYPKKDWRAQQLEWLTRWEYS